MRNFKIIIAFDYNCGISKEGKIPWNIKEDIRHFRETTKRVKNQNNKNAVIMGRKTWDSIPNKFRPLPDRMNIVITHSPNKYENFHDVSFVDNFEKALHETCRKDIENVFVIGGAEIYKIAMNEFSHLNSHIICTYIDNDYNCDIFFPVNDGECLRELIMKDSESPSITKTLERSSNFTNYQFNHDGKCVYICELTRNCDKENCL